MANSSQSPRFENRVVLITGATSGIGREAARLFAEEGARLAFCGRREKPGGDLEKEIRDNGGQALYVKTDVRKPEDMAAFVRAAKDAFGSLDIAINNAGINHPPHRTGDIPDEEFRDVFATNLEGVAHAMKAELAEMEASGKGVIINVASILSEKVSAWMSAYSASKAAVVHLTKCAAADYRDTGIRFYAISPGPVDTPMYQKALKEISGDPEKYAGGLPRDGKPLTPRFVVTKMMDLADPNTAPESGSNLVLEP